MTRAPIYYEFEYEVYVAYPEDWSRRGNIPAVLLFTLRASSYFAPVDSPDEVGLFMKAVDSTRPRLLRVIVRK